MRGSGDQTDVSICLKSKTGTMKEFMFSPAIDQKSPESGPS